MTINPTAMLDDDGHLQDHNQWNCDIAQHLADSLEVSLDDRHYQILLATRLFYEQYQHSPTTRALIKHLNQHLSTPTSNSDLQMLFKTGLIARHISRIAGLPKPANCL